MRDAATPNGAVAWRSGIADVVCAEAERAYPDECCGLLLSHHDTLVRAEPIANGEEPMRRRAAYLLSPGAFRRVEAQARAEGLDIVGVFHSHPDHPARPSSADLEAAWPGWVYVIVPIELGRAGTPLAWRLRGDRSGFDQVPLWHQV